MHHRAGRRRAQLALLDEHDRRQVVGDGSKAHVWMLAVADDLAAVVFIEEGELGSTTAGPVMHLSLIHI